MKKIILILIATAILASCKEQNLLHPYGPDDNSIPTPITNIEQTPIAGGVVLSYTLPNDKNLAYVMAVYTVNGVEHTARSSQYKTNLKIEGLPNDDDYQIKLYSVNKLGKYSEKVDLVIYPGESPVKLMRESLKYEFDFGGFKIKYKNPSQDELSVYILQKDSLSPKMNFYQARVFTQKEGEYQVVGLGNIENRFGVLIKDKFGNTSDSLIFTGKPWREEYLNKKNFKYVGAPYVYDKDDWYAWSGRPQNLWDDIVGEWNFAQTGANDQYPHYFCIDLGTTVPIGRILFQQRLGEINLFNLDCIKTFEVYGAKELPAVNNDDPLQGWTPLNSNAFVVKRPSGRNPGEPPTTEDIEAATQGIIFTINTPFPRPEIRYLRFKFLDSFGDRNMAILGELSFWAQWK